MGLSQAVAFDCKARQEELLRCAVCVCAPHRKDDEVLVSVHPWEISETSPPHGRKQGKYLVRYLNFLERRREGLRD